MSGRGRGAFFHGAAKMSAWGRGGGGGGADRVELPKLTAEKLLKRTVTVRLHDGCEITGVLRVFDKFSNLIISGAVEKRRVKVAEEETTAAAEAMSDLSVADREGNLDKLTPRDDQETPRDDQETPRDEPAGSESGIADVAPPTYKFEERALGLIFLRGQQIVHVTAEPFAAAAAPARGPGGASGRDVHGGGGGRNADPTTARAHHGTDQTTARSGPTAREHHGSGGASSGYGSFDRSGSSRERHGGGSRERYDGVSRERYGGGSRERYDGGSRERHGGGGSREHYDGGYSGGGRSDWHGGSIKHESGIYDGHDRRTDGDRRADGDRRTDGGKFSGDIKNGK